MDLPPLTDQLRELRGLVEILVARCDALEENCGSSSGGNYTAVSMGHGGGRWETQGPPPSPTSIIFSTGWHPTILTLFPPHSIHYATLQNALAQQPTVPNDNEGHHHHVYDESDGMTLERRQELLRAVQGALAREEKEKEREINENGEKGDLSVDA